MRRWQSLSIIWLVCLLVTGCASLSPLEKPPQQAFEPGDTVLWKLLDERRDGDWAYLLNGYGGKDDSLAWRLRLIDSATRSIDLQSFLWDYDASGTTIARHLLRAANRGVRVRLLLDDTFTATHAREIWGIDQHPNIAFRIYNPFPSRPADMVARQLFNLGEFGRLDHRMHNKTLIADNRVAITGGRNMADQYFGYHAIANFRDMDVLTGGPHVLYLSTVFDRFWNSNWTFPAGSLIDTPQSGGDPNADYRWLGTPDVGNPEESDPDRLRNWLDAVGAAFPAEIRIVADDPATLDPAAPEELPVQLARELVRLFDDARSELVIVSAYLVPTDELHQAIVRAVERGVRVRLLTNSLRSNNHLAAHSAYRHHVRQLLESGAEVYEVRALATDRDVYMQTPVGNKTLGLHAKVIIIDDDLAVVGSANMDPRSLRLNTEMALVVESAPFNRRLRERVAVDFLPGNAWRLSFEADGLRWTAGDIALDHQPDASVFARLEDWILGLLPIDGEM